MQFNATVELSRGEEKNFFRKKVRSIISAVQNAPKMYETDGQEQHPVVLHYFHPSGTHSFICEIGENGEAYGYQCLNNDWEMSEFGYLNLHEIVTVSMMELDYHFPEGLSLEQWLYQNHPEDFPDYARFAGKKAASPSVESVEQEKTPFDVAVETGNDIEAIAAAVRKSKENAIPEQEKSESDVSAPLSSEQQILQVLNGRSTEIRSDGTMVFSWPDGRVIVRGKDKKILSDSAFDNSKKTGPEAAVQTAAPSPAPAVQADVHRVTRGEAVKVRAEAAEILKKADSDINAGDLEVLARYEGAGGLHEGGQTADGVLNEFYTPRFLVGKVAEIVRFYKGDIRTALEPAAGTGRFADAFSGVKFTMYERDAVSARINRLLHPDASVINSEFQAQFFDDGGFVKKKGYELPVYDLVVGNPPYGLYKDLFKGRGEGEEFSRYEEYFVSRGLDSLVDGGILAMVLPSSFFNSPADKAKQLIAGKCRILDAYRLPEGVFPSTDVGTDIVLLEKGTCSAADISSGNFFKNHPEKVMGEIRTRKDRFGKDEEYVACRDGMTPASSVLSIVPAGTVEKPVLSPSPSPAPAPAAEAAGKQASSPAPVSVKFSDDAQLVLSAQAPEPGSLASLVSDGGEESRFKLEERRKLREFEDPDGIFSRMKSLSAAEFCSFYSDNSIDPEEFDVIRATAWDGTVDVSALTPAVREYLGKSPKYVSVGGGKYENVVFYASGDIYAKIAALEADRTSGRVSDAEYRKNLAILQTVLPEQKPLEKIDLSPLSPLALEMEVSVPCFQSVYAGTDGADELGEDMIESYTDDMPLSEAFLVWATGCRSRENAAAGNPNSVESITDWSVAGIKREDVPSTIKWKDIVDFVHQIRLKAKESYTDEEKEQNQIKKRLDEDARRLTAEKLFNRFLREGLPEADRNAVAFEWNRRFNSNYNADYSRLPFYVDGMMTQMDGKPFMLFRQQIRGVSLLAYKGNGLLAYEVGVGKTACGIVATISNMQAGRCRKPLIVVPLSVYGKWVHDFKALFPSVPLVELGNMRKKYAGFKSHYNAADHSLDIPDGAVSIVTYEAFQQIVFLPESWDNEAAVEAGLEKAPLAEEFGRLFNTDSAKGEKGLEDILGTATKAENADYVFWERTGFDHVTVDEAHNFKNLYGRPSVKDSRVSEATMSRVHTKLGNMANEFIGLSEERPSDRAVKLFAITQLIQRGKERNVFLLTATPFINNPVEVFSMLSYVARPALKARGVDRLYDFCTEFVDCRSEWCVNSKGKIVPKRVMKNFKNIGALQTLVREFIDKVSAEEAGIIRPVKLEAPSKLSGLDTSFTSFELTDVQKKIVEFERSKIGVKDIKASTLVAITNMRKALLSPVLCDPKRYSEIENFPGSEEFVSASPKLSLVCDAAVRVWKSMPERGQIIYIPEGEAYFSRIVEYFNKMGVPSGVVGMITGSTESERRMKIRDDFNRPFHPMKILIGSKAMSEGMDLNGNTVALYITQLSWNPTDRVQLVGRLWRQGNRQKNIFVITPNGIDSVDSLFLQKHDEKSHRINNIFDYQEGQAIDVSDISPEELKFDLITDPASKAQFDIDRITDSIEADRKGLMNKAEDFIAFLKKRESRMSDVSVGKGDIERHKNILDEYAADGLTKGSYRYDYYVDLIKNDRAAVRRALNSVKTIDRHLNLDYGIDTGRDPEGVSADMSKISRPYVSGLSEEESKLFDKAYDAVVSAGFGPSAIFQAVSSVRSMFDSIADFTREIERVKETYNGRVEEYRAEKEARAAEIARIGLKGIGQRAVEISNYIISRSVYRDGAEKVIEAEVVDRSAGKQPENAAGAVRKEVSSVMNSTVERSPESIPDSSGQLDLFAPAEAKPVLQAAVQVSAGLEHGSADAENKDELFRDFEELVYGLENSSEGSSRKRYDELSPEWKARVDRGIAAYRQLQKEFAAKGGREDDLTDESGWSDACDVVLRPIFDGTEQAQQEKVVSEKDGSAFKTPAGDVPVQENSQSQNETAAGAVPVRESEHSGPVLYRDAVLDDAARESLYAAWMHWDALVLGAGLGGEGNPKVGGKDRHRLFNQFVEDIRKEHGAEFTVGELADRIFDHQYHTLKSRYPHIEPWDLIKRDVEKLFLACSTYSGFSHLETRLEESERKTFFQAADREKPLEVSQDAGGTGMPVMRLTASPDEMSAIAGKFFDWADDVPLPPVAWGSAPYMSGYYEAKVSVFEKRLWTEGLGTGSKGAKAVYDAWMAACRDVTDLERRNPESGTDEFEKLEKARGVKDAWGVFHNFVSVYKGASAGLPAAADAEYLHSSAFLKSVKNEFDFFEAKLGMSLGEIDKAVSVIIPDSQRSNVRDTLYSYISENSSFHQASGYGPLYRISSAVWRYYNAPGIQKCWEAAGRSGHPALFRYSLDDGSSLYVVEADGNVGNRKKFYRSYIAGSPDSEMNRFHSGQNADLLSGIGGSFDFNFNGLEKVQSLEPQKTLEEFVEIKEREMNPAVTAESSVENEKPAVEKAGIKEAVLESAGSKGLTVEVYTYRNRSDNRKMWNARVSGFEGYVRKEAEDNVRQNAEHNRQVFKDLFYDVVDQPSYAEIRRILGLNFDFAMPEKLSLDFVDHVMLDGLGKAAPVKEKESAVKNEPEKDSRKAENGQDSEKAVVSGSENGISGKTAVKPEQEVSEPASDPAENYGSYSMRSSIEDKCIRWLDLNPDFEYIEVQSWLTKAEIKLPEPAPVMSESEIRTVLDSDVPFDSLAEVCRNSLNAGFIRDVVSKFAAFEAKKSNLEDLPASQKKTAEEFFSKSGRVAFRLPLLDYVKAQPDSVKNALRDKLLGAKKFGEWNFDSDGRGSQCIRIADFKEALAVSRSEHIKSMTRKEFDDLVYAAFDDESESEYESVYDNLTQMQRSCVDAARLDVQRNVEFEEMQAQFGYDDEAVSRHNLALEGRLQSHFEKFCESFIAENKVSVEKTEAVTVQRRTKDKSSFLLEKFKVAGIDVVIDKEEFDKILKVENPLQKMTVVNDGSRLPAVLSRFLSVSLNDVAEVFVPVVYSRENYTKIFKDGIIETPMETIKMGSNQFVKLCPADRNNLMLAVRRTLEAPSVIIEKESFDTDTGKLKPLHVYGKSFINVTSNHSRVVESIIVFKDGNNVVKSAHNKSFKDFIKQIRTADEIIYLSDEIISRVDAFGYPGDIRVVKEALKPLSSSGKNSLPFNKGYDIRKVLSSDEFVRVYGVQVGNLEITRENFDSYFNIFNRHKNYKDNPNKIASELFNYHVSKENKESMRIWLASEGYIVKEKKPGQKMVNPNGIVYGFVHDNKVFLNPEYLDSGVMVHEYTHLWDNYIQKVNPELWQKGKDILKATHFWQKVKSDLNYADIAGDDDLVLSEVHARICSDIAEKVFDRIVAEDGKISADKIFNWDKETWNYIASEIDVQKLSTANPAFSKDDLKMFLSMPMKDLMAGVQITRTAVQKAVPAVGPEAGSEGKKAVQPAFDPSKFGFTQEKLDRLNLKIVDVIEDWAIVRDENTGMGGYLHEGKGTGSSKHTPEQVKEIVRNWIADRKNTVQENKPVSVPVQEKTLSVQKPEAVSAAAPVPKETVKPVAESVFSKGNSSSAAVSSPDVKPVEKEDFGLLVGGTKKSSRKDIEKLLFDTYGKQFPGINVGPETTGGACRINIGIKKDGVEGYINSIYVLKTDEGWEIRKTTPYVNSLLTDAGYNGLTPKNDSSDWCD